MTHHSHIRMILAAKMGNFGIHRFEVTQWSSLTSQQRNGPLGREKIKKETNNQPTDQHSRV